MHGPFPPPKHPTSQSLMYEARCSAIGEERSRFQPVIHDDNACHCLYESTRRSELIHSQTASVGGWNETWKLIHLGGHLGGCLSWKLIFVMSVHQGSYMDMMWILLLGNIGQSPWVPSGWDLPGVRGWWLPSLALSPPTLLTLGSGCSIHTILPCCHSPLNFCLPQNVFLTLHCLVLFLN